MSNKKHATRKEQQAAWYKENAERLKKKAKERYRADPEKAKENSKTWISVPENRVKHNSYVRKWAENNPDTVKDIALRKLGWSLESYEEALIQQSNCCALCYKPFTENDGPHADHEHVIPPRPRGLLHGNCNTRLGVIENVEFRNMALNYLRKF